MAFSTATSRCTAGSLLLLRCGGCGWPRPPTSKDCAVARSASAPISPSSRLDKLSDAVGCRGRLSSCVGSCCCCCRCEPRSTSCCWYCCCSRAPRSHAAAAASVGASLPRLLPDSGACSAGALPAAVLGPAPSRMCRSSKVVLQPAGEPAMSLAMAESIASATLPGCSWGRCAWAGSGWPDTFCARIGSSTLPLQLFRPCCAVAAAVPEGRPPARAPELFGLSVWLPAVSLAAAAAAPSPLARRRRL